MCTTVHACRLGARNTCQAAPMPCMRLLPLPSCTAPGRPLLPGQPAGPGDSSTLPSVPGPGHAVTPGQNPCTIDSRRASAPAIKPLLGRGNDRETPRAVGYWSHAASDISRPERILGATRWVMQGAGYWDVRDAVRGLKRQVGTGPPVAPLVFARRRQWGPCLLGLQEPRLAGLPCESRSTCSGFPLPPGHRAPAFAPVALSRGEARAWGGRGHAGAPGS